MSSEILMRNHVNVIGEGDKTLLFIHGYGCDQSMWRFINPAFLKDYKLVQLDLVGCGNSDDNAYEYEKYNTLQGHVDDVLEVCNELYLKDITIIGHSISANIALLMSIQSPQLIDRLVMVCPSPRFINDNDYVGGFMQSDIDELIETLDSNYLGWSKGIAPVIMGHPERPELALELEESFCRNNPDIARHFARVTFLCDNREDLEKIDTKTLIIHCENDNLASVAVGQFVHEHIKGSVLSILDTNGHCPHLSAPKETIEVMKEFFSAS